MAHYKALKAANPKLPVLIRECSGVEPRLTARFGALRMACRHTAAPRLTPVSQRWAAKRWFRCQG